MVYGVRFQYLPLPCVPKFWFVWSWPYNKVLHELGFFRRFQKLRFIYLVPWIFIWLCSGLFGLAAVFLCLPALIVSFLREKDFLAYCAHIWGMKSILSLNFHVCLALVALVKMALHFTSINLLCHPPIVIQDHRFVWASLRHSLVERSMQVLPLPLARAWVFFA